MSFQMNPMQDKVCVVTGAAGNSFQNRIEEHLSKGIDTDAAALINSPIPLDRHARPEEIAQSVLFLASEQCSFSSAGVCMADGGMHISFT